MDIESPQIKYLIEQRDYWDSIYRKTKGQRKVHAGILARRLQGDILYLLHANPTQQLCYVAKLIAENKDLT